MTGRIVFNNNGQRTHFYMEILERDDEALKKIAVWNAEDGITYTRTESDVHSQISQNLQNKTVIVAVRLGMPYLREKYVTLLSSPKNFYELKFVYLCYKF